MNDAAFLITALVAVGVALLAILILRLGRKLAIGLLVLAGLGLFAIVALAMNAQAQATKQAAQAATVAAAGQAVSSAAMSIIAFLLAVIVVLLLGIGLAVVGFLLWQNYQKQRRFQALLERVQRHRLMGGGGQASMPHYARPGLPAAQPGGNILVFGGGYPQGASPPARPALSREELAWLMEHSQGQEEGWDDLFPPADQWRVVG